MGFFGTLFGSDNANAARDAAAKQYAGEQNALSGIKTAGDNYASGFQNLSQNFNPYVQGGGQAQNQLYNLMGLNGQAAQQGGFDQFRADPGYQFQLQQGQQAIDRSAAARSGVNNGATLKATQRFGQGLADQQYGNYLQRLMGLGQQGLQATGSQVQTAGQGLTGQLNAATAAFPSSFKSASTIPMGDIAAQNANNASAGNLLNLITQGAGMALGGAFGNPSSFFGGR